MDISFVIITGGSKPKHVDRLLKSIKKQNIKNFESIVVGNTKDLNIDLFSMGISAPASNKIKLIEEHHRRMPLLKALTPGHWYHSYDTATHCQIVIDNK